jgi:hypothetical protein
LGTFNAINQKMPDVFWRFEEEGYVMILMDTLLSGIVNKTQIFEVFFPRR